MITLAKKLITGSGATEELEVNGYVEFVSSTPMTITPKYTNSGVTLRYSLDGITWTPIVSGVTTPSANIIYFIGRAAGTKSLYTASSNSNAWTFTGATNLECNGKLDRLLQDDLGGDNDVLTIGENCFNYMFYNATKLIKAPILPATTLANYCYNQMFQYCTRLTTAPILPATTLANYCYAAMFYGCTGLKISTILTGIYDTVYRIPTTGTGITATDALASMFTATGGTFIGTPEINTTYYTENTPA